MTDAQWSRFVERLQHLCLPTSSLLFRDGLPGPLIISVELWHVLFQLPTIVKNLQIAWLGRARSNAKRTESLGHHPVGGRVAN